MIYIVLIVTVHTYSLISSFSDSVSTSFYLLSRSMILSRSR